jgi:hypothetical protein
MDNKTNSTIGKTINLLDRVVTDNDQRSVSYGSIENHLLVSITIDIDFF